MGNVSKAFCDVCQTKRGDWQAKYLENEFDTLSGRQVVRGGDWRLAKSINYILRRQPISYAKHLQHQGTEFYDPQPPTPTPESSHRSRLKGGEGLGQMCA